MDGYQSMVNANANTNNGNHNRFIRASNDAQPNNDARRLNPHERYNRYRTAYRTA